MNRKMVFYMVGRLIQAEAILLVLPLIAALCYRETSVVLAFLITAILAAALGTLLTFFKPKNRLIFSKDGFIIVALAWVLMSAIGALPFVLSKEIPSYIDAFFETVSGFTTTGASVVTDIEALSHGVLFWRSFTHWVGGMGVLVFIMAIFPSDSGRSIHIMKAEMPGPIVGKLVPKIKDTAKILYLIYIVMTVLQVIFLLCGGMSFFESLLHAFGTAGTGGFGVKADSIASYSPYIQWVITIFMLLFGINFNLYYLVLIRRAKQIFKSTELWVYLGIFLAASIAIACNIRETVQTFGEAFRLSSFQVSSIITTTGYTTTDFNLWPEFSKGILLMIMLIGGCAGSTAGGLKVSRVVLLFQMIRRDLRQMLHPRSVGMVKLEGKQVDDKTLNGVGIYFAAYCTLLFSVFLLLCLEPNPPFDFETTFSSAVSCFNNVGPAFGAAGPAASYAEYSAFSKILLSVAMLLGRLEIYPMLFLLSPSAWSKK